MKKKFLKLLLLGLFQSVLGMEYRSNPPLFTAVFDDQYNEVCELLSTGANPNEKNINGWTALFAAAGKGKIELAKLLIAFMQM